MPSQIIHSPFCYISSPYFFIDKMEKITAFSSQSWRFEEEEFLSKKPSLYPINPYRPGTDNQGKQIYHAQTLFWKGLRVTLLTGAVLAMFQHILQKDLLSFHLECQAQQALSATLKDSFQSPSHPLANLEIIYSTTSVYLLATSFFTKCVRRIAWPMALANLSSGKPKSPESTIPTCSSNEKITSEESPPSCPGLDIDASPGSSPNPSDLSNRLTASHGSPKNGNPQELPKPQKLLKDKSFQEVDSLVRGAKGLNGGKERKSQSSGTFITAASGPDFVVQSSLSGEETSPLGPQQVLGHKTSNVPVNPTMSPSESSTRSPTGSLTEEDSSDAGNTPPNILNGDSRYQLPSSAVELHGLRELERGRHGKSSNGATEGVEGGASKGNSSGYGIDGRMDFPSNPGDLSSKLLESHTSVQNGKPHNGRPHNGKPQELTGFYNPSIESPQQEDSPVHGANVLNGGAERKSPSSETFITAESGLDFATASEGAKKQARQSSEWGAGRFSELSAMTDCSASEIPHEFFWLLTDKYQWKDPQFSNVSEEGQYRVVCLHPVRNEKQEFIFAIHNFDQRASEKDNPIVPYSIVEVGQEQGTHFSSREKNEQIDLRDAADLKRRQSVAFKPGIASTESSLTPEEDKKVLQRMSVFQEKIKSGQKYDRVSASERKRRRKRLSASPQQKTTFKETEVTTQETVEVNRKEDLTKSSSKPPKGKGGSITTTPFQQKKTSKKKPHYAKSTTAYTAQQYKNKK